MRHTQRNTGWFGSTGRWNDKGEGEGGDMSGEKMSGEKMSREKRETLGVEMSGERGGLRPLLPGSKTWTTEKSLLTS